LKCVVFFILAFLFSCSGGLQQKTAQTTQISMAERTFDFGTISKKDTVVHRFSFVNTGRQDLIIAGAESGCGCTTSSWSQAPVAPGDSGYVEARFIPVDTGFVRKSVVMKANTDSSFTVFYVQGNVRP
jgi:hypothetical protein